MNQRTFEITFTVQGSSNAALQRTHITATDSLMARRIFEQQNPACKIAATPKDVTERR